MYLDDEVLASLTAYVLAAGLLTITPGLDTALVLRTSLTSPGLRAGAAGILVGVLAWGILVAFGLAAVLSRAPAVYVVLKWIGAACLAWLGFGLLHKPRRKFEVGQQPDASTEASPVAWFRRGLLTNLLNPKVGVFYLTFLPRFVPSGVEPRTFMVVLASIHATLVGAWFAVLINAARRLQQTLSSYVTVVDRATGALFVLFALRLGLEVLRCERHARSLSPPWGKSTNGLLSRAVWTVGARGRRDANLHCAPRCSRAMG